jgi:hypothetical protein
MKCLRVRRCMSKEKCGCFCFYTPLISTISFAGLISTFSSCWRWTKSPALYHLFYNNDMDPEAPKQPTKSSPKNGPSDLVDSMSKINLDDENEEGDHTLHKRNIEQPARRLVIYPRPQTLKLSKSPLVKPPDNMPALKDWFG